MTFEIAKEEFKDFLLLECAFSLHTINAYIRNVEKLKNFLSIKDLKLMPSDVRLEHLTAFVQYLNEVETLSAPSQAQVVATAKTFFKFLVLEQVILDSPAVFLSGPKKEQPLPVYLLISEIHDLINVVQYYKPFPHRALAIISILYACGIRVSEMIGIKIEDLYFEVNMIKVLGKGNKERLVPIADFAQQNITQYIDAERSLFQKQKAFHTHVFLTEKGKPLQREYIWTLIKALAKRAHITKSISPHTFRHTLATHLKQAGADLNTIKEILGHESIADTLRYAHLDLNNLREVIEKCHPSNR